MGKMGKIIAAQRKERKINERRNNYWAAEIYNRRHYIIISRAIKFPLPFIFHWGALILARDFSVYFLFYFLRFAAAGRRLSLAAGKRAKERNNRGIYFYSNGALYF